MIAQVQQLTSCPMPVQQLFLLPLACKSPTSTIVCTVLLLTTGFHYCSLSTPPHLSLPKPRTVHHKSCREAHYCS
ncbi:hypothetical protein EON63_07530 [archaeon]|nr:MAG: hypothetical protein EON63_07530 [archaeon]